LSASRDGGRQQHAGTRRASPTSPRPSPPLCSGWEHSEQVFGDMVDRLARAQLVPVVHRGTRAQRSDRHESGRSGAREVPVDPPGRASRRAAHDAASRRSTAPTR
jgi:hypothetical protein